MTTASRNGAAAVATLSVGGFRVEIDTGGHELVADEPVEAGGTNSGPGPFQLLYASLASCIAMTCRMYASRKEWPLETVHVWIYPERKPPGVLTAARVEVRFEGELSEEQLGRLTEIAGKCPVHRTLESGVSFETVLNQA